MWRGAVTTGAAGSTAGGVAGSGILKRGDDTRGVEQHDCPIQLHPSEDPPGRAGSEACAQYVPVANALWCPSTVAASSRPAAQAWNNPGAMLVPPNVSVRRRLRACRRGDDMASIMGWGP